MSIEQFLAEAGVSYERFDHPAVFTCEESEKLPKMPGADTKNLFLQEEKGSRFFLVSVPHAKRADLKALASLLGVKRLMFGKEPDLLRLLGVTPGSVTMMGLMNDTDHAVEFWIDESIWKADLVQAHPLVNTATIIIPHDGLVKFFEKTGHQVHAADIPSR
jgi:Ala-tRNA(Pro) deacylase